ncbi:hypothetical protein ACP70R_040688 [Stipagrostis hirtigluma subsp. patula]
MLHRCSSQRQQQSVAMASAAATFSLFFPAQPKAQWPDCDDDRSSVVTTSPSSPSSSSSAGSVDCTLSLWTPSSLRAAEEPEPPAKRVAPPVPYPSASPPAAASWDVAADQPAYCYQSRRPAAAGAGRAGVGHDTFLDRRCANCGTTSTPLWRNGPCGPKSLCNACGIRFKKEERRAALTAAMETGGGAAGCGYSAQRAQYGPAARAPGGEGAFPCGGGDADPDAPFLAWRLNVVAPAAAPAFAVWPERASLFQYN